MVYFIKLFFNNYSNFLIVKRVAEEKIDESEKKKPRLEEEHVQRGKERLAAKLDARMETSVLPEQLKFVILLCFFLPRLLFYQLLFFSGKVPTLCQNNSAIYLGLGLDL